MSKKDKQADLPDQILDEEQLTEMFDGVEAPGSEEAKLPSFEALLEQVQGLRDDNDDLVDQFKRAKAETENTRRISTQEVAKARKFALEGFAKELLQVKDSLDQAARVDLMSDANDQLIEQMSEGLVLTLRQLEGIFERFSIELVNPEAGDALNPELHQAMTKQASDEVDANNIISTIQTGYTLNERLLRPAMVIVSSGAGE